MSTAPSNLTALPVVEGYLDRVAGDRIIGWAWHPRQPQQVAQVELVAEGQVVAAAHASIARADLQASHKRDGVCGFEFIVDHRLPVGVALTARVVLADDRLPLEGSVSLDSVPARQLPSVSKTDVYTGHINEPLSHLTEISGHIDEFGPAGIRGWVWHIDLAHGPVALSLFDGANEILRFDADAWRSDLADLRQGDGRCGFVLALPESFQDDQSHRIDLRLAGTSYSLLREPLRIRWPARAPQPPVPTVHKPWRKLLASRAVQFSFIIVFYNMRREAERTLRSLTRAYQRDAADLPYEVICIDNGSDPPLDRAWVESFGPEFRLVRPERALGSPCHAINDAAREARGRHLAIMIDGAHLLTPGILREAADAMAADPEGVIAPRRWFVGGDQRWLSSIGYTRDMEDLLFSRIQWPADGYQLFRIGLPIGESCNDWFDGLIESNCLILPRTLYERLGGLEERFTEAGGGFSNLDLFRRAVLASGRPVTCFVGEATFHQFHGGTTSNVTDEEKERRVRLYATRYRELRGEEFEGISAKHIRYRGSLRHPDSMTVSRQRPLFATQLGITDQVRPGFLPQHFDHGARLNVQSAFVESQLYQGTEWRGVPVRLAATDLINIQMILQRVRPTRIVTTTSDDGLISYLDSILRSLGLDRTRIIRVSQQPAGAAPTCVHSIVGDPYHPEALAQIRRAVGTAEDVVVLFAPQPDEYLPIDSIRTYAQFVSYESYCIFLGTVFGQPWLAYSKYWYLTAIRKFIEQAGDFVMDTTRDRGILGLCIGGYLKRVCEFNLVWKYDPSLDYFGSQEIRP